MSRADCEVRGGGAGKFGDGVLYDLQMTKVNTRFIFDHPPPLVRVGVQSYQEVRNEDGICNERSSSGIGNGSVQVQEYIGKGVSGKRYSGMAKKVDRY